MSEPNPAAVIDRSVSIEGAWSVRVKLGCIIGGTHLIRSTAGKVPALKVQFPLWHNSAIEGDGDEITPLAEFEIEMLKTKTSGNRND